jgi:hypothetical protein
VLQKKQSESSHLIFFRFKRSDQKICLNQRNTDLFCKTIRDPGPLIAGICFYAGNLNIA